MSSGRIDDTIRERLGQHISPSKFTRARFNCLTVRDLRLRLCAMATDKVAADTARGLASYISAAYAIQDIHLTHERLYILLI